MSAIVDACNKNDLPQPNVITESGRSLTAHHSILIFEVLETTQLPVWKESQEISPDDHELARELYDIWGRLDTSRLLKAGTTRSRYARRRSTFSASECSTCAHAPQIEKLFWSTARGVGEIAASMKHVPEDLRKIAKMIPDKYFCNFSLFQSLPDSWAIDQIFPIVPISRLDEKPTRTCTIRGHNLRFRRQDSKFHIGAGHFVGSARAYAQAGEPYYLGVFLVGALSGKYSATRTISSAIPMPCISVCTIPGMKSTRLSRAKPSTRCSTMFSTTQRSLCAISSRGLRPR